MKNRTRITTRAITSCAILIALQVVLSRFCSINAWNLKIGLGFLPVAMAGLLFGPIWGAVVGGMGDFVGALLFPIGPYFPGFTVSLAMTGVAFGLVLHKKRSFLRVVGVVAFDQLLLSLLLNSWWISVLYGSAYKPLLVTRSFQCVVMIPVEIVFVIAAQQIIKRTGRRTDDI